MDRVLALAEAADPALSGPGASAESAEAAEAQLATVAAEIAPAIEWALANDLPRAVRLVAALSGYWQDAGRVDEGRRLTEQVVSVANRQAATDTEIAAHIARALLAASELAFRQGDQKQATKRARDTIRAAMLLEDRATAAMAHNNLARVAYRAGDAPTIEKHARKALELAGDDPLARRGALHMLAWAAHTAGDLDEAERRFEESLRYRRQVGSRMSVASEIANLGDLAAERGNLPRAADLLSEALAVSHEIGSQYMLVNTLPSFASLAVRAGLMTDAARLFGAADAAAGRSGLTPDPNASADQDRSRARETIGRTRFDALTWEGRRMSVDDAVGLAQTVARRIGGERVETEGATKG